MTFRQWLLKMEAEIGVQYSNPVNDDRYAEKGVRSNREGDKAAPVPGPFNVDPDDMYLTGKKRAKKRQVQSK
jgi:hypothetical protein